MTLETIFGQEHQVSVAQESARALLVLIYGLAMVRVAGRRLFGKWSALDIVVSIVIGSNLSRAITGNAPFTGTLVATTVLVGVHWMLAYAAARWRPISVVLEGRSIPLMHDGRIRDDLRIRHGVSDADVNETLRGKGLTLNQAVAITLEPSGTLNVEGKR